MTEPDPQVPRPTGRPNARLRQTVGDMVRSLVVVLAVVGVILLVTWRPQPDPVRIVDPAPTLAIAQVSVDFPIAFPEDLPPGWRPTSVRFEITPGSDPDPAWQIGYVTPTDAYAQIGQSATVNPDFIVEQTLGGTPTGAVEDVDGREWQWFDDGESTEALVTIVDGITVVVSGTADRVELITLARALPPLAGE